jgi:hypothetical protein
MSTITASRLRRYLVPLAVALVAASIAGPIFWHLTRGMVSYRHAFHAVPMQASMTARATTFVAAIAFIAARLLGRSPHRAIRGLMLAYRAPDARTASYRERVEVSIADLVAALEGLGYRPELFAADPLGARAGALDPTAPLVGASLLWRDRRWRGWIRVQLPTVGAEPTAPGARLLGLLEIQGHDGPAIDEASLYTLRALDELLGGVAAGRVDSRLGPEPASLLTCALPPRPALAPGAGG